MRYLSALKNANLEGKTCLLRVDFNVEGAKDAFRLQAALPTMKFLLSKGSRVVILSHRGRPDISGLAPNKRGPTQTEAGRLSLRFALPYLEKELQQRIEFVPYMKLDALVSRCRNLIQRQSASSLRKSAIFLLENLRFYPEEEKNDLKFAKKLARLGDFYVNDAFGVSHRENASVTQLPKLLPAYAGLLLEKEIKTLAVVMKSPKRPLVLIFGGAKIKDKLPVIKNLLPKANKVLLGSSILNYQYFTLLRHDKKVIKPMDCIGKNSEALDIGPLAAEEYKKEIKKAKTIIWNGPLGLFEDKRFAAGSIAVAKAISKSRAFSVVGGGETTQLFMRTISNFQFLISKKRLFLSTGGGAMLEFLSGKKLPGIAALK